MERFEDLITSNIPVLVDFTLMIFKDGKQLWRQSGVMRANDLSIILAQYE